MNILKVFVIISLILITLFTGVSKPKIHKHFILVSPNFKLANNLQKSNDMQSVRLFKIGEEKTDTSSLVNTAQEDLQKDDTYYSTKETTTTYSYPSSVREVSRTTSINTDRTNVSRQVSDSSQSNAKAWADLEKKTHEMNEKYKDAIAQRNKADNRHRSNSNDRVNSSNNVYDDLSCPICDMLHDNDNQYKDETIAWNKWRSDIQNKIMDDSDVDAGYGTIFYFSFKVDRNRNITNINVICTDFTNKEAINQVRRAISNLKGQPILKFPKNSNRNIVNFNGGFSMSLDSRYASPSDYNDFERIRFKY